MSEQEYVNPATSNNETDTGITVITDESQETRVPMLPQDVANPKQKIPRSKITIETHSTDDTGDCMVACLLYTLLAGIPALGAFLLLSSHFDYPWRFRFRGTAKACGYVFLVAGYITYLGVVLRWHKINRVLSEMVYKAEFIQYVEDIKKAGPRIVWRITCFDDKGRVIPKQSETQERESTVSRGEKKTLWTDEQDFVYNNWEDITPSYDLRTLDSGAYHVINLFVEYHLADERTSEVYKQQKANFVAAHKGRGRSYKLEERIEINGIQRKDKVIVRTSWSLFLSLSLYRVAALLLLAFPWIWIVKCMRRRTIYRHIKSVFA